jgi:hypothetical protein
MGSTSFGRQPMRRLSQADPVVWIIFLDGRGISLPDWSRASRRSRRGGTLCCRGFVSGDIAVHWPRVVALVDQQTSARSRPATAAVGPDERKKSTLEPKPNSDSLHTSPGESSFLITLRPQSSSLESPLLHLESERKGSYATADTAACLTPTPRPRNRHNHNADPCPDESWIREPGGQHLLRATTATSSSTPPATPTGPTPPTASSAWTSPAAAATTPSGRAPRKTIPTSRW